MCCVVLNYCSALNIVFLPFLHRMISSPRRNGSLCNFASVPFVFSSKPFSHITMQLYSICFILIFFVFNRFLRSTDNRPQSCFSNASSGPKIFCACYSCTVHSFRFFLFLFYCQIGLALYPFDNALVGCVCVCVRIFLIQLRFYWAETPYINYFLTTYY